MIRSAARIPNQLALQSSRICLRKVIEPTSLSVFSKLNNFSSLRSQHSPLSISHYATSAFANAKPLNHSVPASTSAQSISQTQGERNNSKENQSENEGEESDPDEPPKKATIRERLRFLTRRYGWWALGVYLLASTVDFSLVFLAIHLLGADHIRELEDGVRKYFGMGKREMEDHEVAAWPVPASVVVGGAEEDGSQKNNEKVAGKAVERVQKQKDVSISSSSNDQNDAKKGKRKGDGKDSSTLWTEAVLAYTIHKTLLLPFRVGITAAVTPTFVKYMVRLGWAKNNAAVQQAAQKAKMAKEAAKKAVKKAE
ncbi:hypothetical protein L7F22_044057 [Adiantum nelumboides]|nr:hypothetical protein [Adiantum nelumboides]